MATDHLSGTKKDFCTLDNDVVNLCWRSYRAQLTILFFLLSTRQGRNTQWTSDYQVHYSDASGENNDQRKKHPMDMNLEPERGRPVNAKKKKRGDPGHFFNAIKAALDEISFLANL